MTDAKQMPSAHKPPCILLVDDERSVRRVGEKALQRAGFSVLVAENGREAVELYSNATTPISLVILDLTMPEMSGSDTFTALQKIDPDVRILISSGYDAGEASSEFAGRGLLGVIQKPYRVNTLLERVRDSLPVGAQG